MLSFCSILFLLAVACTGIIRRYTILDMPNHRSSHTIPTPRGGGLSFVFCFLTALPLLYFYAGLSLDITLALGGGGFLVAMAGFLDDYFSLSMRWRFLFQMAAAGLGLYFLGGMPDSQIFSLVIPGGIVLDIYALLYLVWLINLYNFMDGIDGIAGMEALSVCVGALIIYGLANLEQLMIAPMVLIAVVAGFLIWNFPKAKIFMGDAGSGFLGLILGLLSIQAAWVGSELYWSWLILLGVFVVDATFTLFKRAFRGQRIFDAHRTHAYQYASRYAGAHWKVTVVVVLINLCWLLPMALLVASGYLSGMTGFLIAYAPLLILAIQLNAGNPELECTRYSTEKPSPGAF